ncbi:hypothetical protein X798_03458 [Onchocerca flexuosa]|uniref:Uncharacterized protein n=1 Tax=Onchocerca flexuosa TaxID=387005 RepID=A0A238BVZ3_9BILA|nr:hypothetical protein X798_03458 [Onchocerca flexuosa]
MPNDLAFNRQYSEEEQSIDMRREGTEEERKMQMDERMLSTAFSFPTEVIEFLSAKMHVTCNYNLFGEDEADQLKQKYQNW